MLYSSTQGARYVLANRLGLGATRREVQRYRSDPKEAARAQIGADLNQNQGWQRYDPRETYEVAQAFIDLRDGDASAREDARMAAQALGRGVYASGVFALIGAHLSSEAPFAERWSAFFSNHLAVSASRGPEIRAILPLYEHEVIRPHCFGRFADLVFASATHAGMLLYLDQAQSVGPNSWLAGRRQQLGLNENYARELLELHTVGVDGGYDLEDIQSLAKLLTGWTLPQMPHLRRLTRDLSGVPTGAAFIEQIHEPGRKTVLGTTYGEGPESTRQVIEDLCARPETANFLSGKVLQHFVGDAATPADQEQLARAYLESGGDLSALAEALLDLDSLWRAETPLFRKPLDFLVALGRGLGFRSLDRGTREGIRQFLSVQKQLPWTAPSPQGWSEDLNAWADPNALKSRTDFIREITPVAFARARIDASDLGERLLDLSAAPALASALGNAADREQALTLLLASPQFMWR